MVRAIVMNSKDNATISVVDYGVYSILLQPLIVFVQEKLIKSLINIM